MGGGVGSGINIGHIGVHNAALNASGEESGEYHVPLYSTKSVTGRLALALRMRTRSAIRSSHIISCIWGGVFFFSFFFPVSKFGRRGSRARGTRVEVDGRWRSKNKIKLKTGLRTSECSALIYEYY